jgi:hypothetical protein
MIRRESKPSCHFCPRDLWCSGGDFTLGEGLQTLAAGDCKYDMRPANRIVVALEVFIVLVIMYLAFIQRCDRGRKLRG